MMPKQELLDAPAKVAEYSAVDAGLADLRKRAESTVFDITTTEGDKTARALRAECVTLRTTVEARRVEAKAPLLEKGRVLDAEAKRITAEITQIEKPLDTAIKAEERRKADEKAAKERAIEAERRKIDTAISEIHFRLVTASGKPSADIQAVIDEVQGMETSADFYGERVAEAVTVKNAVLSRLSNMFNETKAREEADARLAEQNAELERRDEELRQREKKLAEAAKETGVPEATLKAVLHMESAEAATPVSARGTFVIAEDDATPFGLFDDSAPFPDPVDDSAPFGPVDDAVPFAAPVSVGFDLAAKADESVATTVNTPSLLDMAMVLAEHYEVDQAVALQWMRDAVWGE